MNDLSILLNVRKKQIKNKKANHPLPPSKSIHSVIYWVDHTCRKNNAKHERLPGYAPTVYADGGH